MRLILWFFGMAWAASAAGQLTLAREGKAAAQIVIADGADASIAAAAADLGAYLKRITGAGFAIRKESQVSGAGGARIVIGSSKLSPESFLIRTAKDRLFILGADSAGVAHGVADFLERDLGVRWLWPGELGTVIPERKNLAVGPIDRSGAPAFPMRRMRDGLAGWKPQRQGRSAESLAIDPRRLAEMTAASRMWASHMKLGESPQINLGHAFTTWWNEYHERRPDFFAMMPDGSRQWPWSDYDRVKLCVSNKALHEEWMRKARVFFERNPDALSFSASANDNEFQGHCLCPECERLDDPSGEKYTMRWRTGAEDTFRDHVSLTDRYVHFYNALADLLAKEFRGKMVGGHAYATWKNPPVRERELRPNVLVGYVGFNDIYISGAHRRRDLEQWRDWASLTKQLFYRPNFLNTGHGMPLVFIHKLAADIKYRAGLGLMGADFDSLVHHWSTQGLNYYVLAKLLWDPRLDVDALFADYCRSAFGPAAPQMRQYYLELEKRTDWIAQRFEEGQVDRTRFFAGIPEFYSPAVLGQWRAQLAAALRAVPADSVYARRIRWVAQGLDYASVTVKTLAAEGRPKEEFARERNAWYRAHLYDWSVCPPLLKWREPAKFFGN